MCFAARFLAEWTAMRKAMAFPVRFVAAGQTVQTTSRDLDDQTVFVRCVRPPSPGERVVLRLYLPGGGSMDSMEAEVVESDAEGFRARFPDLPEEARHQIRTALLTGKAASTRVATPRGGENKRFLPRYLDRFPITVRVGARELRREAVNVSASGLFFESAEQPDLQQTVQLVIELPDGREPATVEAIVLRRVAKGAGRIPGAGVQFIGADDAFRARLDAYLEKLKKR